MNRYEGIGFVPTMGALHEGHLALIRQARRECARVVVSVFVNPTQFGPTEDFERYPRDEARDRALVEEEGAEVWFPRMEEVYPEGEDHVLRRVPPDSLTQILCGKDRPDHFSGVATVVERLLSHVQPTCLYLGQKDYQQTRVLQWVVDQFFPNVQLSVLPTVRERDGLALSSRNRYLSLRERSIALALPRALEAVRLACQKGEWRVSVLQSMLERSLEVPGMQVMYAEIRDAEDLKSMDFVSEPRAVALAAVRVGATRLIDNVFLG